MVPKTAGYTLVAAHQQAVPIGSEYTGGSIRTLCTRRRSDHGFSADRPSTAHISTRRIRVCSIAWCCCGVGFCSAAQYRGGVGGGCAAWRCCGVGSCSTAQHRGGNRVLSPARHRSRVGGCADCPGNGDPAWAGSDRIRYGEPRRARCSRDRVRSGRLAREVSDSATRHRDHRTARWNDRSHATRSPLGNRSTGGPGIVDRPRQIRLDPTDGIRAWGSPSERTQTRVRRSAGVRGAGS